MADLTAAPPSGNVRAVQRSVVASFVAFLTVVAPVASTLASVPDGAAVEVDDGARYERATGRADPGGVPRRDIGASCGRTIGLPVVALPGSAVAYGRVGPSHDRLATKARASSERRRGASVPRRCVPRLRADGADDH